MHENTFDETLDLIRLKDPRFEREAYLFVREALDFTQKLIAKNARGRMRHVSGGELLDGIRQYSLEQFGPMAITVLDFWGIRACRDFGEIVFNMVEFGLLAKTDQDSLADFEAGYDFAEAFRRPFLPPSKVVAAPAVPTPASGK